jgi:hypothetical protein
MVEGWASIQAQAKGACGAVPGQRQGRFFLASYAGKRMTPAKWGEDQRHAASFMRYHANLPGVKPPADQLSGPMG